MRPPPLILSVASVDPPPIFERGTIFEARQNQSVLSVFSPKWEPADTQHSPPPDWITAAQLCPFLSSFASCRVSGIHWESRTRFGLAHQLPCIPNRASGHNEECVRGSAKRGIDAEVGEIVTESGPGGGTAFQNAADESGFGFAGRVSISYQNRDRKGAGRWVRIFAWIVGVAANQLRPSGVPAAAVFLPAALRSPVLRALLCLFRAWSARPQGLFLRPPVESRKSCGPAR